MKPAPFNYHAPESVADAVGLLADLGDDAKPLAGGQSLIPLLALRLTRFDHLVDLNKVSELSGISQSNGTVRVGAMTRQAAVAADATVKASVPLLHEATQWIGHFQIRNRGTLGGSVAHADPAAEYPAAALCLDAEMEIAKRGGSRRVPAKDFFQGTFVTAVEGDELLVAVHYPVWGAGSGFGMAEMARRMGDFAIAGALCGVQVTGGKISRAALAFMGMGPTPMRSASGEAALVGQAATAIDLAAVAAAAVADTDPSPDIHASAMARQRIATKLVRQAVGQALSNAGAK